MNPSTKSFIYLNQHIYSGSVNIIKEGVTEISIFTYLHIDHKAAEIVKATGVFWEWEENCLISDQEAAAKPGSPKQITLLLGS